MLWQINARGAQVQEQAVSGAEGGGGKPQSAFWSIVCVTNGGTGARPMLDGLDATAYPSGVKGTPIEINEKYVSNTPCFLFLCPAASLR